MIAKAGADWITFHCEASRHIDRTIGLIRECGARPGLVFNPATPLACLEYELDKIDMILLMSVNPGFGGQKFIPGTLAKIRAVRALVERHYEQTGHEVLIEVDGGIKPANIAEVAAAGANVFVAGSAIYGAGDKAGYEREIRAMREAIATRC
jgi:ribulose-phosphate 3-epimerase